MLISMLWVLTVAASAAEPKPAFEFGLFSLFRCDFRSHVLAGIRFAPTKNWMAVLLQHGTAQEGALAHLLLISQRGELLRPAAYTRGVEKGIFESEILWWSPDSSYLASACPRSITVFRSEGTSRCEIPLSIGDSAIGFVSGPLFVVATGRSPNKTVDFYRTDCTHALSERPPSESYDAVAVPLDGESLAFIQAKAGVILTDALGGYPRKLKHNYWGGRLAPGDFGFWPQLAKSRYTESGRVLCIASSNHTHCFENDSGDRMEKLPKGMRGRMMDASAAGSRIVYPYDAASVLELVGGAMSQGRGAGGGTRGCMVWDYREGKQVLLWTAGRAAEMIGLQFRGACALSAAGDFLAVGTASSVRVYELHD